MYQAPSQGSASPAGAWHAQTRRCQAHAWRGGMMLVVHGLWRAQAPTAQKLARICCKAAAPHVVSGGVRTLQWKPLHCRLHFVYPGMNFAMPSKASPYANSSADPRSLMVPVMSPCSPRSCSHHFLLGHFRTGTRGAAFKASVTRLNCRRNGQLSPSM